jgi:hypothetical protein
MFRYDQDKGGVPLMRDRVEVCHTANESSDGLQGTFAGYADSMAQVGIVILDKPYYSEVYCAEVLAITMPVVCLRKV